MADEQTPAQETELETIKRQLGERDNAFGKLKSETESLLAARDKTLTEATAKYQALLVQSNPEIPAEMIKGNSITELDASLTSGKAIVQRIKDSLQAQAKDTHIPAGAPPRQTQDLSGLSGQAKIVEGLKRHDRK